MLRNWIFRHSKHFRPCSCNLRENCEAVDRIWGTSENIHAWRRGIFTVWKGFLQWGEVCCCLLLIFTMKNVLSRERERFCWDGDFYYEIKLRKGKILKKGSFKGRQNAFREGKTEEKFSTQEKKKPSSQKRNIQPEREKNSTRERKKFNPREKKIQPEREKNSTQERKKFNPGEKKIKPRREKN